ncbi:MAG: polysaccharide deacetylase family protein [Verrucomicrobia bacterium]|nr:polysaccharide deacetylase family protein [Verrucomicrobiota bacterium]
MSIRSAIAPLLHRFGHAAGLSLTRAKEFSVARIITFHAVGVPSCSVEAFTAQLEYLKRNFHVVPLAEMVKAIRVRQPDIAHWVALTFDDGTRNNGSVAAPLLKRLGLPATFFICPGLAARGGWLWNHEARERLRSLPAPEFAALADSFGRTGNNLEAVINWTKTLPLHSRTHIERVIRDATPNFRPSDAQRSEFDLMNWDELKALDPALITLGAHSTNHPILANCTAAELAHEVVECRALLENELGRPIEFFCYPNGDFNEQVAQLTRVTYTAAVTTQPGFVCQDADYHRLPRLNCCATLPHFAWRLHRPTA